MSSGATRTDADSIGPFRLLRRLGAGGMAEVWEAERRERPGERVALKTLPRVGSHTTGAEVRKFWEEARIARALDHQNIVRTMQAGVAEERVFLVMELLEGRTLAQLDARAGRLPLGLVGGIAIQVLEGLAHAHQGLAEGQGLVHRDIKPSNLFVTAQGIAKVIDFGLAVLPGVDRTLTSSGLLRGSLPYCSPEQVKHEPLDARADLFSFGLVLYELLAGKRVFDQETEAGILSAVLWTPVPPLKLLRPGVPAELDALVQSVLAKSPGARPASAVELSAALRGALGAENLWAPPEIAAWLTKEPPLSVHSVGTASVSESSPETVARVLGALPSEATPLARSWRGAVAFLVALLAVAAMGAAYFAWHDSARERPPAPSLDTSAPAPLETRPALPPPTSAPATVASNPPPATSPVPTLTRTKARPAAATGWLTVGARNGWANVTLDGKSRGPTPLFRLVVPAGRHRVEAHRPDGTVVLRNVLVDAGRESKLIFSW